MLQGKIVEKYNTYKITAAKFVVFDVTHYIGLLHHPRLYLGVYMGALSPVKETWLPPWAPCPRERNMAASVGALSPVKGAWLPPWVPCYP